MLETGHVDSSGHRLLMLATTDPLDSPDYTTLSGSRHSLPSFDQDDVRIWMKLLNILC